MAEKDPRGHLPFVGTDDTLTKWRKRNQALAVKIAKWPDSWHFADKPFRFVPQATALPLEDVLRLKTKKVCSAFPNAGSA